MKKAANIALKIFVCYFVFCSNFLHGMQSTIKNSLYFSTPHRHIFDALCMNIGNSTVSLTFAQQPDKSLQTAIQNLPMTLDYIQTTQAANNLSDIVKLSSDKDDTTSYFFVFLKVKTDANPYTQIKSIATIATQKSRYKAEPVVYAGDNENVRAIQSAKDNKSKNSDSIDAQALKESEEIILSLENIFQASKSVHINHAVAKTPTQSTTYQTAAKQSPNQQAKIVFSTISWDWKKPLPLPSTTNQPQGPSPVLSSQQSNIAFYLVGGGIVVASFVALKKLYNYWYPKKKILTIEEVNPMTTQETTKEINTIHQNDAQPESQPTMPYDTSSLTVKKDNLL